MCVCAKWLQSCPTLSDPSEYGRQGHPDFAVQGVPSMVMGPTSQRMAQYRPEKVPRNSCRSVSVQGRQSLERIGMLLEGG